MISVLDISLVKCYGTVKTKEESFLFQKPIASSKCCAIDPLIKRRVPHELFPKKAVPHQIPAGLEIFRKFILAWRF